MDEYLAALFSAAAFTWHMRREWKDGKVMNWHSAQLARPTLPEGHRQALKVEAQRRGRMYDCGGNG